MNGSHTVATAGGPTGRPPSAPPKILLLGIGNVLWGDEGFGVRTVEHLHRHFQFPENVQLLDGGTQGLYLLPHVEEAEVMIVFDAVEFRMPPGTLVHIRDGDVPRFMGAKKMSLHQTGFQEVLALAELTGKLPKDLHLIGVQPEDMEDYGGSLRPIVRRQIEPAIETALNCLASLGVRHVRREQPLAMDAGLTGAELDITAYESGRPDAQSACRLGDARFLNQADPI